MAEAAFADCSNLKTIILPKSVSSFAKNFIIDFSPVKRICYRGVAKKLSLKNSKKFTLKTVITPLTSLQKVTYKSSNKKVATVTSKGVIKTRKKGTAVITVKSGRKTIKCKITVK